MKEIFALKMFYPTQIDNDFLIFHEVYNLFKILEPQQIIYGLQKILIKHKVSYENTLYL